MKISIVATLVAGALSVAAHAEPAAPEPQPAAVQKPAATGTGAAAAEDPGNKQRCRSTQVTGSRLGSKRVCMTVREWAEHDRVQTRQNAQPIR